MKSLLEILREESEVDQNMHQNIFSERLKGQTIKSAHVKHTATGGEVELEFVSTKSPSKITWTNEGKITFSFKGTKYLIKK